MTQITSPHFALGATESRPQKKKEKEKKRKNSTGSILSVIFDFVFDHDIMYRYY